MAHGITWTLWFLSFVTLTKSHVAAQDTSTGGITDAWADASPAFLQLNWPDVGLLHVSLSELSLVAGIKKIYSTKAVTVVNVRNTTELDSETGKAVFEMLFLVEDKSKAFKTTEEPTSLATDGLVTALGLHLQATVLEATTDKDSSAPSTNAPTDAEIETPTAAGSSAAGGTDAGTLAAGSLDVEFPAAGSSDAGTPTDAGSPSEAPPATGRLLEESTSSENTALDPLWQLVAAFQSGGVTCKALSNAEVLSLYDSASKFPALFETASPKSAFLTFTVLLKNINDPANFAQSVVYQVQRGVAQFLGGSFRMDSVVSAGPVTIVMASDSALKVSQSFFLLLPSITDTTKAARETLASLLTKGDPTRPVTDDTSTKTWPATFLRFIFSSTEVAKGKQSYASTAGTPSFAATLLPLVFDSVSVVAYPDGNPDLPTTADIENEKLLAAISEEPQNALRRKKQQFVNDPDDYLSALPEDVIYPSSTTLIDSEISGDFITTVYWSNILTQDFWLESLESAETLSWNLFPSTTFFAADTVTSFSLPAPIIKMGNKATPLWTFKSAIPEHLDLTLYLRGAIDNATQVKVEVEVTLHDSGEAESTVTSVTRSSSTSSSVTPSDIVVRHQSRLQRNGVAGGPGRLLLLLELAAATVTEKSVGGCAHCQQLFDWCTNEEGCSVLQTCVLTAIQSPISDVASPTSTLNKTEDLYSHFKDCLDGSTTTSSVDVSAVMLFTSAVRCQLQRLCTFPSPSNNIVVPSETKLLWESSEGQHRIQPETGTTNFPLPEGAPVDIALSIGSEVVCHLSVWSNASSTTFKSMISHCGFAKYLGNVMVNVSSDDVGATSVDIIYSGLVGPMPVLSSVSFDEKTEPVGALVTIVATPSLHLYVDPDSVPDSYEDTIDPTQIEVCAECKRLAVDVCLRDAKCAAMADCILQYKYSGDITVESDSTATSTSPTLAYAALQLLQRDEAGFQLSFKDAVTSCHPAAITDGISSVDVNGASWRKLVDASACYSRSNCPIVLAPMLSSLSTSLADTFKTVGRWTVTPIQKLQRLIYTGATSTLDELKVPLVLKCDGVEVSANSAADPKSLEEALRAFVKYDDIGVAQVAVDSSSTTTKFAWTIAYRHWLGALPVFISTPNKEWTLVSYPTISTKTVDESQFKYVEPSDVVFKIIPRRSNSTDTSATDTSTDTTNSPDTSTDTTNSPDTSTGTIGNDTTDNDASAAGRKM